MGGLGRVMTAWEEEEVVGASLTVDFHHERKLRRPQTFRTAMEIRRR